MVNFLQQAFFFCDLSCRVWIQLGILGYHEAGFTIRILKLEYLYEIKLPKKHSKLYIVAKVLNHGSIIFKSQKLERHNTAEQRVRIYQKEKKKKSESAVVIYVCKS